MYLDKVKVKEAMARKGIKTQTELAKKLGITKNQLSVILSEKFDPIKANVNNICSLLDVTAFDIVDGSHRNKPEESVKSTVKTNGINTIELFAGAGGLALGLEQADLNTVLLVEIDKYCCETLRKNRPEWNVVNKDVTLIDFTKYHGQVDLVTGGFPCQAFSYAGKKLGFEDIRGTLFYEFARCIKEVDPPMFIGENVRGLISHDNGRTLTTIIEILSTLGYNVQYKLLNAVDYGVPQKRERIVIVGTKSGMEFMYPTKDEHKKTLKDALLNVPKSEGQQYSAAKKAVLDLVPPGGCWRALPEEIQKQFMGASFLSGGGRTGMARRISWDEPSLTLTCSPSQKQTERCHPDETRPFTVREYARIQTFPDAWDFAGGMGEKYRQIGNAVPVELAKRIGEQAVLAIHEYKANNKKEEVG